MRAVPASGIVLAALGMLGSCVARDASQIPRAVAAPTPEEGAQSYRRACASCHGIDGRGGGPVARALRVPPPDLTELRRRHGGRFPRDLVVSTITGERAIDAHGDRDMPVWSQRFGPVEMGATAVAAGYARRRIEMLADHIETLERDSVR